MTPTQTTITGGEGYRQMLEKAMTEYEIQTDFMRMVKEWSRYCSELALMYSTPNEGIRGRVTAAKRKAEGMRSGIPDVCLPVHVSMFGALYIEFKAEGGRLKPAQKIITKLLAITGNAVLVCWTPSGAWDLTQKYINGELDSRFSRSVAFVRPGGVVSFVPVTETINDLTRQLRELDEQPKPKGQFRRGGGRTFRK